MDNQTITLTEDFWNHLELSSVERVEGRDLILGGRTIERRLDGTVVRDETTWNLRLIGGAPYYKPPR